MSDALSTALNALSGKLEGTDFDGSAKFTLEGLGSLVLDGEGARMSDDEADVTMIADPDVFQEILSGELNPTAAFMSGRLKIEGDMGVAMKLAQVLA